MSIRFSAEEAQARLPELLDRAESGEEIVITRFGAPSAVLRRADSAGGTADSGVRTATQGVHRTATQGVHRTASYGVLGAAWSAPVVGGEAAGEIFDVGTDYGDVGYGDIGSGDINNGDIGYGDIGYSG